MSGSVSRPNLAAVLALLALILLATALRAEPPAIVAPSASSSSDYGELPLSFVPNRGQSDAEVRYSAQAGNASFQFTRDRIAISLRKGDKGHALHLRFLAANPNPTLVASDRQKGRVNYIRSNERQTNLPTFAALTYRELWPGIDMAIRGAAGKLKYEFHLAPGADPADIRLAYAGASGLSLTKAGALNIGTSLGPLTDQRPRSFQGSSPVESRYALHGERSYGFTLGAYDRTRPLVIDPAIQYSLLAGSATSSQDITVDPAGSAYITGRTFGEFPVTPGAYDTTRAGTSSDVYVAKLDPTGASFEYSTYLGGSDTDGFGKTAIAIDQSGSAYVAGDTLSTDFPITPGAADPGRGLRAPRDSSRNWIRLGRRFSIRRTSEDRVEREQAESRSPPTAALT
jgi:Beta-propeller repeat